jgi:hypothetical protein
MILSAKDRDVISSLGYPLDYFCYQDSEGFYRLKNHNGSCVFLEDNKCHIYSHRPQGCRFYPLIYDLDLEKAVVDKDCPLWQQIDKKTIKKHGKALGRFIKAILQERDRVKK